MDSFVIEGGHPLKGHVSISGSKNAALPLMAAALLSDAPITLTDVPDLRDIRNMGALLETLGCTAVSDRDEGTNGSAWTIHANPEGPSHAVYDIVKTMRASICILGPTLARRGHARVSMPGGCAIGTRPVDLHIRGLRALGAEIHLEGGDIVARCDGGRLRGATIFLGGPSGSTVLGTANVMSAATLAEGTTVIESAACEPEIVDVARLLTLMGANIRGAGTPRIIVEGVEKLEGAVHRVMPDRIEAGTYMMAGAITNSEITLRNCPFDSLMALCDRMEHLGVHCRVDASDEAATRCDITVHPSGVLHPVQVTTQPHPGFPTDLQAQLMAVVCLADGNSAITERIFPERFLHVPELSRMGAQIVRQGPTAIVSGVAKLVGAPVMASDLRASAGLVLAGLAARGRTVVDRVYHLDRGYESMEKKLNALGACIQRVDESETSAKTTTTGSSSSSSAVVA